MGGLVIAGVRNSTLLYYKASISFTVSVYIKSYILFLTELKYTKIYIFEHPNTISREILRFSREKNNPTNGGSSTLSSILLISFIKKISDFVMVLNTPKRNPRLYCTCWCRYIGIFCLVPLVGIGYMGSWNQADRGMCERSGTAHHHGFKKMILRFEHSFSEWVQLGNGV